MFECVHVVSVCLLQSALSSVDPWHETEQHEVETLLIIWHIWFVAKYLDCLTYLHWWRTLLKVYFSYVLLAMLHLLLADSLAHVSFCVYVYRYKYISEFNGRCNTATNWWYNFRRASSTTGNTATHWWFSSTTRSTPTAATAASSTFNKSLTHSDSRCGITEALTNTPRW